MGNFLRKQDVFWKTHRKSTGIGILQRSHKKMSEIVTASGIRFLSYAG